jgi:hypothetical protein
MSASEALNSVGTMLKSYPATNQPDAREYVTALAGALCRHPREIAAACVHPVTGIIRECMFKPTVVDIERWCKREAHPQFDRLTEATNEARGANANDPANAPRIIDRSTRQSLDELRAKHGPTWGIKTTASLDLDGKRIAERNREMRDRQVLAEYASLGIDPVYASDGTLASPSLLRSIERMPRKHDHAPVHDSDR